MATSTYTAIPLSSLFSDATLKAFFERGEKDHGMEFAVPAPRPPMLSGGAEAQPVLELV